MQDINRKLKISLYYFLLRLIFKTEEVTNKGGYMTGFLYFPENGANSLNATSNQKEIFKAFEYMARFVLKKLKGVTKNYYFSPNFEQIKAMIKLGEIDSLLIFVGGINCSQSKNGIVSTSEAVEIIRKFSDIPILGFCNKEECPDLDAEIIHTPIMSKNLDQLGPKIESIVGRDFW